MFPFTAKEKALDTLAILCKRCEQVNCDLAYVDKKFEKEFEEMEEAMEKAKEVQRLAEIAMNAASGTRDTVVGWQRRLKRLRLRWMEGQALCTS